MDVEVDVDSGLAGDSEADRGLGSWIRRRRVKSAGHPAIIFNDVSTSYDKLDDRISGVARSLRARGVEPGDRVAYLGDNHPSFVETMFAVLSLGAIFVPLNTRLAAPEIEYALADSGCRVLIYSAALAAVANQAASGVKVDVLVVVADVAAAEAHLGTALDYEALTNTSGGPRIQVPSSLDDPAIILYTSGTTGRPKGALLTHGNLTWNAINVLVDYDLTSTDIALMISPLFHAASLGMGMLPALMKGATVVLEPRFDPERALAVIERYGVTWVSGVPTTFQLIAEHPAWATTDIGSLRSLTCGGSPVPLRVLEAYEQRGLSFTGGYGLTETAPGATSLQPTRSRSKAGSAGLPHFFTAIRLRDEEGKPVPVGEVGEIQISGPNVIAEYWRRPDESSASFVDGTWFRTGDLGYVDNEGFLYVSDRLKDMIISGGENVYPAEVEQLILQLDAVGGAAVIGVPDERWGEVPLAVITVREGFELAASDVTGHLDGKLARYKIPKRVVIVDDLPRTASGKIRKAELRATFAAG